MRLTRGLDLWLERKRWQPGFAAVDPKPCGQHCLLNGGLFVAVRRDYETGNVGALLLQDLGLLDVTRDDGIVQLDPGVLATMPVWQQH